MYDTFFSPSFGNRPQKLVGRDNLLKEILDGLYSRPGNKDRSVLLLGQRGMGKTVLLLEMAEKAKKSDYIVASPTIVMSGMLERIIEKITVSVEETFGKASPSITGGSLEVFGFGAGVQFSGEKPAGSFALRLSRLCKVIEQHKKRLLILIDEVHPAEAELKQLVTAYQEMVGEGHDIAMIMAGLPSSISVVLNDKVLTFLNRSRKIHLDPLKAGTISAYYKEAFSRMSIDISASMRQDAARRTQGSPYLMQLIGHYIVTFSMDDGAIDQESYREALETAQSEYAEDICQTVLSGLSRKDVDFLRAMSEDEGSSTMSFIAERLGKSRQYAQQYKDRLISAGVIESSGYGEVRMVVPYLKEYLKI